MSGPDLKELDEVKRLIARGLRIGVLTYAEIATATAELDLEDIDVEELHGIFERCEIELIEELDPAAAATLRIERAPEKRTRRNPQLDLEPEPEATTDGLQLFLKGIGKVRLLTAQEEVDPISGTDSDTNGDTGTWSYTLTVTPPNCSNDPDSAR
jgi:RNA polymerase primary sigma factor